MVSFKCFSGANTKKLDYCVVRTLVDETPQTVLIHIGSNDITESKIKQINWDDLAQKIIVVGLGRNRNRSGVIIYVKEDIPSKILKKRVLPTDIEVLFIELNFENHPPPQSYQCFFDRLDIALDVYSNYENSLLVGDFNAQIGNMSWDFPISARA